MRSISSKNVTAAAAACVLVAAAALAFAPTASADCTAASALSESAGALMKDNPSSAAVLYEKAASECPESAALRHNLGLAFFSAGSTERALAEFVRALAIDPSHVESMNGAAMAYITLGRGWDKAKALVDKALAIRPEDPVLMSTSRSIGLYEKAHDISTLPDAKKKNAYAVLIGIERYRDLPRVDNAANDARWMRDYLVRLAGVPEENTVLIQDERASRADLIKHLDVWLGNNVTEGASVYVYYAGHGAPDVKTKRAYIVPYDGDPNYLATTSYSLDSLYESLGALPAASVLVMLDSCFSGGGERSVVARGMRPVALSVENPVLSKGRTVVLSAATGAQASSFYEEAGHGLFTYYLMSGMRGEADANADGSISALELYDYVSPKVSAAARRMNREQTPTLLPTPGTGGGLLSAPVLLTPRR